MNILLDIIFYVWCLRILANIFSFIQLWFIKEYRLDRMLIHLRTNQGKKIYFLPFRRPPIIPKTICLFFLMFFSNFLIFWIPEAHWVLKLFIIDLLSFPISGFWVFILHLPTIIWHKIIVELAKNKLQNHKSLKIIGITGSFGKTSTKEYLYTILSEKFNVLKTEASKNSLIGIAEMILHKLTPDHQILIAEMGAYKMGEIKQMVDFVNPQIGIITAINAQHQDLFGSLEATIRAKFELIEGLKDKKIAIFNADNKYTFKMAEKAHQQKFHVWLYGRNTTNYPDWPQKILRAQNIDIDLDATKFDLTVDNQSYHIQTSVLGEHQVGNILAAIAGSLSIGMDMESIVKAIKKLTPYAKTFEKIYGMNGTIFINDTFNNNPDAARAAIKYLSLAKGNKILVFQPMIELGKYANESHRQVGEYAAKYCDWIFLTNNNFYHYFQEGVTQVNPQMKASVLPLKEIAAQIKSIIKPEDMVIFKGKEAENVLKILI